MVEVLVSLNALNMKQSDRIGEGVQNLAARQHRKAGKAVCKNVPT
jgi:hypothetical protein